MPLKKVNLALQGGGAHGAFTWGALDRLLEDERIEIEGITGTSAGAMNAAALKYGWMVDGPAGARKKLDAFWEEISAATALGNEMLSGWLTHAMPDPAAFSNWVERSPVYMALDAATRIFSPYEINPLGIHPLRPVVEKMLDFEKVCAYGGPKLFVSATNVRSGKIKVFSGTEISVDALLASACLPTVYQAIEIEDPDTGVLEAYWDGGYMGNPALFPLFYETEAADVLIVHINPTERTEVPTTATAILNRVNEISFNSSLFRELRAIDFVRRLIEDGKIHRGDMKEVLIHSIMDNDLMAGLGVATKLTPNRSLLLKLKEAGRAKMDAFLDAHFDDIGNCSTVDLRAMFE